MAFRKLLHLMLLIAVLHVFGALSAFGETPQPSPRERQLTKLYTELSQYSSDKLVKMGEEMFEQRHEFDSAMVCFTVVTNRYKPNMNKKEKAVCLQAFNSAGYICCYHYYDYTLAYDMLSKAKEIGELFFPDNPLLCRTYLLCGNLFVTSSLHYDSENLMNTSISYFKKSIETAYRLKDWEMYAKAFIYISALYNRQNKPQEALKLVTDKELRSVPESTPNYQLFNAFYNVAQQNAKHNYAGGRQYLTAQIGVKAKSHIPHRYKTLTMSTIAHSFEMENNLDSALAYYFRILSIADKYQMKDVTAATYTFLANDYNMSGDETNYFKFYRKYVQLKDSLLTISGLEQVGEKHFLAQVKEEANKVDRLHEHNVNMMLIAILLAVATIISMLISILVHHKNKYLNERNKLLYERVQSMMKSEQEGECCAKKYQGSCLSEDEKQRILGEVKRVMQMTDEICKPTFTIEDLAQLIGVNSRYVSQVVNECYGKNFSSLLAEQRVKEACKRFDDVETYGNLTIEAVAQSVGFRSRNSLITAFKRFTGLTPSEYQKVSKNKK